MNSWSILNSPDLGRNLGRTRGRRRRGGGGTARVGLLLWLLLVLVVVGLSGVDHLNGDGGGGRGICVYRWTSWLLQGDEGRGEGEGSVNTLT